jgi:hypothetical protein
MRYDLELDVGLVSRRYNPYFAQDLSLGWQFFLGPQFGGSKGRLSGYALVGVNYLRISGHESWESSGSGASIIWYGSGGSSDMWAKIFNEWESEGSATIPGYDAFSRIAPALCIGGAYEFLRPRGRSESLFLYFDYTPVFDDGLRHDFRFGGAIGWGN